MHRLVLILISMMPFFSACLKQSNTNEIDVTKEKDISSEPENTPVLVLPLDSTHPYEINQNNELVISPKVANEIGLEIEDQKDPLGVKKASNIGFSSLHGSSNSAGIVVGVVLGAVAVSTGIIFTLYAKTDMRSKVFRRLLVPASDADSYIYKWFVEHRAEIDNEIDKFRKSLGANYTVSEEGQNGLSTLNIMPKQIEAILIMMPGNGGFYESYFTENSKGVLKASDSGTGQIREMLSLHDNLALTMVNYRLEAKNLATFVNDVKTILRASLKQVQDDYRCVTIWGQSFGGAISTVALAQLVEENPDWRQVKLINDQSFSSVSRIASATLLGVPESFFRWLFRDDWNLEAVKAIKKLDEKNVLTVETNADEIIKKKARIGQIAGYGHNIVVDDVKHIHPIIIDESLPAKYLPNRPTTLFKEGESVKNVVKEFLKTR